MNAAVTVSALFVGAMLMAGAVLVLTLATESLEWRDFREPLGVVLVVGFAAGLVCLGAGVWDVVAA